MISGFFSSSNIFFIFFLMFVCLPLLRHCYECKSINSFLQQTVFLTFKRLFIFFKISDVSISDASFISMHSYMAVRPPKTLRYITEIHVQIKPRDDSGLLLYIAEHMTGRTGDFLSVSLHKGRIQLRYRLGKEQVTVVESLTVVNIRSMYEIRPCVELRCTK